MATKQSSSNNLVLFNSTDPRSLVNWLCDNYGLSVILQSVAQYQESSSTPAVPTKRAYIRRAGKKGSSKKGGAKKGSSKKGRGKKRGAKKRASKKGSKQSQQNENQNGNS